MKPHLFGPLCALLLGSIGSLTYGAGLVLGQTTWMAGNGHTYAIVEFPEEAWTTAAADITSTLPGFHLATITSQAEQDFVWNFVVQTTGGGWEWWLGGFQDLQNETDPAAGWMWVTGEPWDYTNWWSSEPNNAGGIEDHLALSGGLWNDEGTAISLVRGYVAEKSNSPILDIEKLTNGDQADGANWPDVPRINAGSAVIWTYVVTNNDQLGYSEAEIHVTDSQPGVSPTLDTTSDDGDMILSPGETWTYTAVAEALDLSSPPAGVTVVPGCGDGRNTYQNVGQVETVGGGVIDQDFSHYCNLGLLRIDIRKETEGADSRTFPSGSDVPFEIQVTNNGTIDLDDIVVSDPLLPACDRNVSFLAAGSSTTYTCNAFNVTENLQNEACVSGRSTETFTDRVEDCDLSTVEIAPLPQIVASEYLPLADNNSWTYSLDGFSTVTGTVLPGATVINGVATKAIQDSDGGIDYYTSDANGVRQHGEFDPSPPAGTVTFSPPIVYARGISPVPDTINNAGTASFSFPDLSPLPFVFNYTETSVVEAFETITVPAGTFKTLRTRDTLRIFGTSQGITIDETFVESDWNARHIGNVKAIFTDSDGTGTAVLTSTNIRPPLFSATLPGSRSVQVPAPATAFAAIANPSGATATGCSISPLTNLPANFLYQTTDPLTNTVIGTPNTPATIAPEGFQTFMIAFTPTATFAPTVVELQFNCTNTAAAPTVAGVNTLLLSASDTPVPDIIAIAATLSGDGIISIPGATGTGAFSVATANVGTAGLVTASVDTGLASLPLSVSMCETDPLTAACISPVQSSVVTTIGSNATPTFSIFVGGAGNIPFDPANNRVFVRFLDAGGVTRGATSVAVRSQ